MDEQLHIIIAGETGSSHTIPFTKKKLRTTIGVSAVVLTGLIVGCFFATSHTLQNSLMRNKIETLENEIQEISNNRIELKKEIASINDSNTQHLSDLKVRHDLETTTLQLENAKLMSNAVSELNERSELIESVMSNVGVKIKKDNKAKGNNNSGGPYIPLKETSYDDLLDKADNYLKTIKSIPVGRPVSGAITSRYGKRLDPVNGKSASHTGVDIRGKRGEKIFATASGTVTKAFKNGGYGNYVEIDHGNGYKTRFAHMQNFVVKKGERIEQGQLIGQVGNTGRSTGPHLHYEILLSNKTVNPSKFLKIADLTHTFKARSEK